MVVDGVMDERVAPAALVTSVLAANGSAESSVPTAVGDASLLLDIDVNEVARVRVLVADRFRFPHGQPGDPVDVGQARHLEATEHILDR